MMCLGSTLFNPFSRPKSPSSQNLMKVKVIDHFLEKEERHVLFVVPTKALVSQQAKCPSAKQKRFSCGFTKCCYLSALEDEHGT